MNEALARDTEQDHASQPVKQGEVLQELKVVIKRLSETYARVNHQPASIQARFLTGLDTLFQPIVDIEEDIVVTRFFLHRLGVALSVHENDRGAGADVC